jgi:DNA-binding beta-propeller fold protein YncE
MFDSLFGEGQYALKMLLAFIVVFGLLALALWLVRRFGGERLAAGATRGRQPRLAVIDTATNKLKQWVSLPGIAYGTAPTPDGRFLVIALISVNKVAVLDLQSMLVARTIDVPKAPQEVLVRPDGRFAYVSCDASHQVAVIDTKEWKVDRLIEAGPLADGLAWAAARP